MTRAGKDFSVAEHFGRAITLYADNFVLFFNLSFLCVAPTVLKGIMGMPIGPGVSWSGALAGFLVFLVYTYFLMFFTFIIASRAMGVVVTVPDALVFAGKKFPSGALAYLLFSALLFLGFLCLLLPGIYVGTVFCLFIFAVLLEHRGIWGSLQRSHELVKGRFRVVLAANAVLLLVAAAVFVPLVMGMGMMGFGQNMIAILSGVASTLLLPVFVAFYYFIYATLKDEKDGVLNISVHRA